MVSSFFASKKTKRKLGGEAAKSPKLGGGGKIATRPPQAHHLDRLDIFDTTLISVKRRYISGNSEYFGHFYHFDTSLPPPLQTHTHNHLHSAISQSSSS